MNALFLLRKNHHGKWSAVRMKKRNRRTAKLTKRWKT
jgi:hypothetical protein